MQSCYHAAAREQHVTDWRRSWTSGFLGRVRTGLRTANHGSVITILLPASASVTPARDSFYSYEVVLPFTLEGGYSKGSFSYGDFFEPLKWMGDRLRSDSCKADFTCSYMYIRSTVVTKKLIRSQIKSPLWALSFTFSQNSAS